MFLEKKCFSEKDIQHIKSKGLTVKEISKQISKLKQGMSFSHLASAARLGKGISNYNANEILEFRNLYDASRSDLSIIKFVPASGAATRMFKFLFQFLNDFVPEKESVETYINRSNNTLFANFITNIKKLPFYNNVTLKLKKDLNYEAFNKDNKRLEFVKTMLNEHGFNFSFLPKGLIPFHNYGEHVTTAFEEHLFESSLYASSNNIANLHFTISKNHHEHFLKELNKIKKRLETQTKTKFNITFSYQKETTDTVALTSNGDILRGNDNSIIFRPGGHGALLENLNDLNADLIFIKNIDNIVVSNKNIEISNYKKLLAGVLIKVQKSAFSFLHKLDENHLTDSELNAIALFLEKQLNVSVPNSFNQLSPENKTSYLRTQLDRPIRVCGIVKNEGEPGGGPFWVKDEKGNTSIQIVEFAQIDFSKDSQKAILDKATHFNPVDLVCGVKNYKGEKFDLTNFVDYDAAFITEKTQNGMDIKGLELPGLWNGSMAYWNTILVEVPLATFNPVKTVNDLLKPAHQL